MQLHLFPTITKFIELEADSPKNAFYRLMIQEHYGQCKIIKESGANGIVLDRREWPVSSMQKAVERFDKIIKNKTSRSRGSPRIYKKKRARSGPANLKYLEPSSVKIPSKLNSKNE